MRLFDHFPEKSICPICGKSDDSPCFLMPIAYTQKDRICEAQPTHAHCIYDSLDCFVWDRDLKIIYMRTKEE